MASRLRFDVYCNEFDCPKKPRKGSKVLRLEYRPGRGVKRNMNVLLPGFLQHVYPLSPRILDLLEIASYIYCADRLASRGNSQTIEYHNWARKFRFHIKVRDEEFWARQRVTHLLEEALVWMTGDASYEFRFQAGHSTEPAHLFDQEGQESVLEQGANVALFSGGLDSLSGVVHQLKNLSNHICLVSHQSQTNTVKTQRALVAGLQSLFPNRVTHIPFVCTLHSKDSIDENQRSRAFLYTSIAFSVCTAVSSSRILAHENGITALNLPKRSDLFNARASRTAHPKTLSSLADLFREILDGRCFEVENPFAFLTRTEVLEKIASSPACGLVSSSVSCGHTRENLGESTHCGTCSQCIDRRFAAFAAQYEKFDPSGLYRDDFLVDELTAEQQGRIVDYVRQGLQFANDSLGNFETQYISELADIVDYIGGDNEFSSTETIFNLCKRHGDSVRSAIINMRRVYDDPYDKLPKGTLLTLINDREHMLEPAIRLASSIAAELAKAIPIIFQRDEPKSENHFNDAVQGLLTDRQEQFSREFPALSFAYAKAIPDHARKSKDLLIESKFVRDSTTPAKVTDGIAADLVKYGEKPLKLFLIYDPQHHIIDEQKFRHDFESQYRCQILVFR